MVRWRNLLVAMTVTTAAHGADIWRCTQPDGVVAWQDRPCPASSPGRLRKAGGTAGTFNTIPASRPPASLLERARRAADRHSRSARHGDGGRDKPTEQECAAYENRSDAIDRRLRKGYSAGEGNELRAERRRVRRYLREVCR